MIPHLQIHVAAAPPHRTAAAPDAQDGTAFLAALDDPVEVVRPVTGGQPAPRALGKTAVKPAPKAATVELTELPPVAPPPVSSATIPTATIPTATVQTRLVEKAPTVPTADHAAQPAQGTANAIAAQKDPVPFGRGEVAKTVVDTGKGVVDTSGFTPIIPSLANKPAPSEADVESPEAADTSPLQKQQVKASSPLTHENVPAVVSQGDIAEAPAVSAQKPAAETAISLRSNFSPTAAILLWQAAQAMPETPTTRAAQTPRPATPHSKTVAIAAPLSMHLPVSGTADLHQPDLDPPHAIQPNVPPDAKQPTAADAPVVEVAEPRRHEDSAPAVQPPAAVAQPSLPQAMPVAMAVGAPALLDAAPAASALPRPFHPLVGAIKGHAVTRSPAATAPSGTELVLHPVELGRIRFALSGSGDQMTIAIAADNGDTLALLQRHAGDLQSELAREGLGQASLSFGASSDGSSSGAGPRVPAPAPFAGEAETDLAPLPSPQPQPRVNPPGGLDLRF
jgi:flagellar hook-length control protein FliK